jgi:hypothetical protein
MPEWLSILARVTPIAVSLAITTCPMSSRRIDFALRTVRWFMAKWRKCRVAIATVVLLMATTL